MRSGGKEGRERERERERERGREREREGEKRWNYRGISGNKEGEIEAIRPAIEPIER